jgi:hypothetical protein
VSTLQHMQQVTATPQVPGDARDTTVRKGRTAR